MNKAKSSRSFDNKKARFDYFIDDEIEAGVVLNGLEVKSIRAGKLNLTGSYAKILGGELYWVGGNIALPESDPMRSRKLLVKKIELSRLIGKVNEKGLTLVIRKGYFKNGKFKLLIGVGKGKKKHDKRESIKKRQDKISQNRYIKNF